MYLDYLKERYHSTDFDLEEVAKRFESMQKSLSRTILKKAEGFMVYELLGDALLIHDFYIKPEYRGHTKAWDFHNEVVSEAKQAGKRVALAFSEFLGKDHIKGIKAMKVSSFVPAFKTNHEYVFIKGI